MVIGKLGFGKDDFFYGLELCLARAGRRAYAVNASTASGVDVILFTAFWFRDLYLFAQFLDDAGIKLDSANRPKILVGGMQATMAPAAFAELADWVFVGDADDHLGGILDAIEAGRDPDSPYLFRSGDSVVPAPSVCAPSGFVVNKGGKQSTARIEIARGCKFSCAFCALTGLKPYTEVPTGQVISSLQSVPSGKSVVLFAPERTRHSGWVEIKAAVKQGGYRDMATDVRLDSLAEAESSIANIGIEGISHRLRKSIGKAYSQEFILDRVGKWVLSRPGVTMLSMYFVADLPGECKDDWAELWSLFEAIEKQEWSRRLNLKPVLNPLAPKPFTALANAKIHPFRDYASRWSNVLRKAGSQWGFRIVETMVWPSSDRILDAIVQRGGSAAGVFAKSIGKPVRTKRPRLSIRDDVAKEILNRIAGLGVTAEHLNIEED